MLTKLYRRNLRCMEYAECWINGKRFVEHYGVVGKKGVTKETGLTDPKKQTKDFVSRYAAQGYAPLRIEDQYWLVVQFPVETQPKLQDTDMIDKLKFGINNHIGWLGLGIVDGYDSGQSECGKIVVNIFCVVVDENIALDCLKKFLPKIVDCSNIKMATRKSNPRCDYELKYTSTNDHSFFL